MSGAFVCGCSVWDVKLKGTSQKKLVILVVLGQDYWDSVRIAEARITADSLEFTQFIYLLRSREEIRNVINAITTRGGLILRRFGGGGLEVLRSRGATRRDEGDLPILFDIERPAGSCVARWQCVRGAFPFSEGRINLFFAERLAKSSDSVVLCGGTKRASEASDDLKYLRSIPVLPSSGSVFGAVFRYS